MSRALEAATQIPELSAVPPTTDVLTGEFFVRPDQSASRRFRIQIIDPNDGTFLMFTPKRPEGFPMVIAGNNQPEVHHSIDVALREVLLDADLSVLTDEQRSVITQRYGLQDGKIESFAHLTDGNRTQAMALTMRSNRALSHLGLTEIKNALVQISPRRLGNETRIVEKELEERAMVEEIRAGSQVRFERYFKEAAPRIYKFIARRSWNHETAEELTSEAFALFWADIQAHGFDFRGISVNSHLIKIARNLATSYAREMQANAVQISPLSAEIELEDFSDSVDERVDNSSKINQLRVAMRRLSVDQRRVILLRTFKDLKAAETAALLNKTENNVKVLQHNAIINLQYMLGAVPRPEKKIREKKKRQTPDQKENALYSGHRKAVDRFLASSEPVTVDTMAKYLGIKAVSVRVYISDLIRAGCPIEHASGGPGYFIPEDKKQECRKRFNL